MRAAGRVPPDRLTTPPGYEAWTASEKQGWVWERVTETAHTPTLLPPLCLPFQSDPGRELAVVLRRRELDKALTRTDDLMEVGRPKVIHARGSVATVELDTDSASPFTGLLAPAGQGGGGIGLLRLSLVARVSRRAAYTPALALKLFVDGCPSADVLAMNHTVGQGRDFDLFSNTMTNDLTHEHRELRTPQRVMSFLFHRVSRQPRRLVSDHLASRRRDGRPVTAPVAPDRLVFHPTDDARRVFVGQSGIDFRLVLVQLPPGSPLYEVVGVTADGTQPVGVVRTTSAFVSSDAGDRLFFRHVQEPSDRKLRVRS